MRSGRSYAECIEMRKVKYPKRFNQKDLATQFIPYFENGKRIEVLIEGVEI